MDRDINGLLIGWLGESSKRSLRHPHKPSRIYIYESFEETMGRKGGIFWNIREGKQIFPQVTEEVFNEGIHNRNEWRR